MIELPLRIECGMPCREPAAWLLPGDDARVWVEEIARWAVAHSALRLLVVPRSRQDLSPAGVVIVCPDGVRPDVSPRCLPYGRVAGRLYLPVEARLQPDVSDEELVRLLAPDREYVFHPGAGLCGYGSEDVRSVADLLRPPPRRERSWDRPRPGVAFARRLVSLSPTETPSVEQVMERGRDDIGTKGNQLSDLPPSPDEPSSGILKSAGRYAVGGMAGLIAWLTKFAPNTATSPTWLNRLQDWALRKQAQVHDAWNRERMKEILRLMEELRRDPDRGLKYALPLGEGGAPRGFVPGGNRLTLRDINFNLRSLGGGGPVSYWALPDEFRQMLVTQYRELANRELQIGRHRRAAYIFATLLGDLESAASALTQGCHWREAAVLYRDKLKRPLDAARCLEQGGLWTEAIELYESVQEFEKAGDLCRRLEQEDAAVAFYERAVAEHQKGQRLLPASGILVAKLNRPNAALTLLDSAWPYSGQGKECLKEAFRLRSSLGRHEDSGLRLRHLREESLDALYLVDLVEALADVATSYPDRVVSQYAADTTRVRASEGLISPGRPLDYPRLVKAVERLAPEDRLLSRDCSRYLREASSKGGSDARPARPGKRTVRLIGKLRLPAHLIEPYAAIQSADHIYLAGRRERKIVLACCTPSKDLKMTMVEAWPELDPPMPIRLGMAPANDDYIVVHAVGRPVLNRQPLFFGTSQWAGGLAGMSPEVWDLHRPSPGTTRIVEWGREVVLKELGPEGQVLGTHILSKTSDVKSDLSLSVHSWLNRTCVGMGSRLILLGREGSVNEALFHNPIRRMTGTALHRLQLLFLGFDEGGVIFNLHKNTQHPIASDAPNPLAAFIGDGMIAVASVAGIEVYIEKESSFVPHAMRQDAREQPLAVLPTSQAGKFAVVSTDGLIEWFEV